MQTLILLFFAFFLQERPALDQPTYSILTINGSINPTTFEYLKEGIHRAEQLEHAGVVIEMNTPGGLLQSTRDIVTLILNAKVPVIVYVSPSGSRAASAGVFITMSGHIAAMAPGTNIGAAHPVSTQGEMDSVMSGKVTNDAAAFIRSITEKRNRNIEWAEDAVRNSVSITEKEALDLHVIDLIAASRNALLDSLDGRTVIVETDTVIMNTSFAIVEEHPMDWQYELLNLLSDPNVSYILFLIGIYGLFFELYNPGSVFPGVVGSISIILALYAMQTLPVNYAGLALIIIGAVLFLLEIKITSYGLLTVGGIVALFFGSIMLFKTEGATGSIAVSLGVIIPLIVTTALFFLFIVGAGIKAQRSKTHTGESGMIGEIGIAITDLSPLGQVRIQGEMWNAESVSGVINKNEQITVTEIHGLNLKVKRTS